MKYTINGKEYSEFDIKKRCAEIVFDQDWWWKGEDVFIKIEGFALVEGVRYDPCNNPADTWPIIESINDGLFGLVDEDGEDYLYCHYTRWEHVEEKYKCSKLIAACICLIKWSEQ